MSERVTTGKTFIDLFAGCGGLSLGLMRSGWTGLLAVEKDSLAFETLEHNLLNESGSFRYAWPQWLPRKAQTIGRFINKYNHNLHKLRGKVDLICGGPPCQGFSLAGRRKRDDPRNTLFRHYVEVVKAVQPKFLLLENVRGIDVEFGKKAKQRKRRPGRRAIPFSHKIKVTLEQSGYEVYPKLLRAAEFGVPQLRPRYFMIAIKSDLILRPDLFNPFAHLDGVRRDFLTRKGLSFSKPVSVKEAISDLEIRNRTLIDCVDSPGFKQIQYGSPETYYQRLMHGSMNGTAPNSLRLARHQDEIRKRFADILRTCRRGVQLCKEDRKRLGLKKHCTVPLDPCKPSHTLTTLPDDILHYAEPRILSVREYARLQSFPDWYDFKGKYTTGGDRRVRECPRYTQVGNAVPPFVAEFLGDLFDVVNQQLALTTAAKVG